MDVNTDTEAGVVAALTAAAMAPSVVEHNGRSFLIAPEGVHSQEITDPHGLVLIPPGRTRQKLTIQTKDSLGEYTIRYRLAQSTLFADIDTDTIVSAIDYHAPDGAAFCDHAATLKLSRSVEWAAWSAIHGKMMDQQDFARFIEENAADIASPEGADLLEIVKDLQAVRGANFKKVVRTSGDIESFEYAENTEARAKGGTVEVPTKFKLDIPVYFGEPNVGLFAFLRWKLMPDGNLTLGVSLHRAEHVRQAVFQQIVLDLAERTECPAVFGKSEN